MPVHSLDIGNIYATECRVLNRRKIFQLRNCRWKGSEIFFHPQIFRVSRCNEISKYFNGISRNTRARVSLGVESWNVVVWKIGEILCTRFWEREFANFGNLRKFTTSANVFHINNANEISKHSIERARKRTQSKYYSFGHCVVVLENRVARAIPGLEKLQTGLSEQAPEAVFPRNRRPNTFQSLLLAVGGGG